MKRPSASKKSASPAKATTTPPRKGKKTGDDGALHIQREVKPAPVNLEDVRRRAYECYLDRMQTGAPGCPDDDWIRAERELGVR